MGVTVKKCHRIMSGNDCWNRVCFSSAMEAAKETKFDTNVAKGMRMMPERRIHA